MNRTVARVVAGRAAEVGRAGDGAPIVLLHGAGANQRVWDGASGAAWAGYERWTPSLPGRPGTGGPPAATAAEAASWLAELMASLGLSEPLVLGHSYGGAVALELALAHPDRVRGIVLVASGARLRVAPGILEAAAKATDDAPMAPDLAFAPATPRAVIDEYVAACRATPAATTLADWRACDRFDVREHLGDISCPALVVFGDQDLLTPARHQRKMVAGLPRGVPCEVAGAGHQLPWEHAAALVSAVRAHHPTP